MMNTIEREVITANPDKGSKLRTLINRLKKIYSADGKMNIGFAALTLVSSADRPVANSANEIDSLARATADTQIEVQYGVPGNKTNEAPKGITFGRTVNIDTSQTQEDENSTEVAQEFIDRKIFFSRPNDFAMLHDLGEDVVSQLEAGSTAEFTLTWDGNALVSSETELGTDAISTAVKRLVSDSDIPAGTEIKIKLTFDAVTRNEAGALYNYRAGVEAHYTLPVENVVGVEMEQPVLTYIGANDEVITVRGLEVAANNDTELTLVNPENREDVAAWLNENGIAVDSNHVVIQTVTTEDGNTIGIVVFTDSQDAAILARSTVDASGVNFRTGPSTATEQIFNIQVDTVTAVSPLSIEAQSEIAKLRESNPNLVPVFDYEEGVVKVVSGGITFIYGSAQNSENETKYLWLASGDGFATVSVVTFGTPDLRSITPPTSEIVEGGPTPPAPTEVNPEIVAEPAPEPAPTAVVDREAPTPANSETVFNEEEWFNTPLFADVRPTALPYLEEWRSGEVQGDIESAVFTVNLVGGINLEQFEITRLDGEILKVLASTTVSWTASNGELQYATLPLVVETPFEWTFSGNTYNDGLIFTNTRTGFSRSATTLDRRYLVAYILDYFYNDTESAVAFSTAVTNNQETINLETYNTENTTYLLTFFDPAPGVKTFGYLNESSLIDSDVQALGEFRLTGTTDALVSSGQAIEVAGMFPVITVASSRPTN